MRPCSYCGTENDDANRYCAGCGISIESTSQALTFSIDRKVLAGIAAWGGLATGVACTAFVVLVSVPLFHFVIPYVPPARHIHVPAGWSVLVVKAASLACFFGLPCGALGIANGKKLIGWLAIVLAFAPFPAGFTLMLIASVFSKIR